MVRGEGHRYYVDDIVPGRAEASPVAGESPGVWSGRGAAALGLDGLVEAPVFASLLEGRHPQSGRTLGRPRGDRRVSGYDLTFGAPKSVSILAMLAPGEIAAAVGAGHRAAVEEAAGYLGRSAVGVRRSHRGVVAYLPSTGMVAGSFVHRTSRALDPHLHTHLVMANVAQGVDGRWSAVDSRRVFVHAPATQAVYHARLRLDLTDRLGAAWAVRPSGLGDVVGVDARLRRLFSTRTSAIDEYVHSRQGVPAAPGGSRGAFHATRPDKDRSRSVDSLLEEWRGRAADFGHDLGDLTRAVGLGGHPGPGTPTTVFDPERISVQLQALAGDHRALRPRDLVALVATSSTRGAGAADIESTALRIAGACRASRTGTDPGKGAPNRGDDAQDRWPASQVLQVVEDSTGRLLDGGLEDSGRIARTGRMDPFGREGPGPSGPDAPGPGAQGWDGVGRDGSSPELEVSVQLGR